MGLRIIDVIEWPDQGKDEIMQRVPDEGQGDIRFGSQLIVRPSQVAMFVKDGKVMDLFSEGRYTLDARNLPIITGILKLATNNKTPFPAEVYFITTKDFLDLKWGTPGDITVPDSILGMVQLKAFGNYAMSVAEPRKFIEQVVGVQGVYNTSDLQDYLRGILLSQVNGTFGATMESKSLLNLSKLMPELGPAIQAAAKSDFAEIGLTLKKVIVAQVEPSDEVKHAIAQRGALGAIGVNYMQYQAGQAMLEAAKNPGGGLAAMGAGLGAGMGIGGVMGQAVNSAIAQPLPTPGAVSAAAQPAVAADATHAASRTTKVQIQESLTKLDMRFANGEISEAAYNKLSDNLNKALAAAPDA